MRFIKKRVLRIYSNGSLNICLKFYKDTSTVDILEQDNKNFHLNKKSGSFKIQSESSEKYKKKYLF